MAAEDCEMVVIPRELYNDTVASVLEEEFRMKQDFIENVSFFSCCSQKHKRQLLMAFESHSCEFPTKIITQGERVTNMIFLMSGEVRLSCEVKSHFSQYEKLLHLWEQESNLEHSEEVSKLNTNTHKRGKNRPKSFDICLLSPSKYDSSNKPCICDIEMLLNMPIALCSATATSHCVLLSLHFRHFERILLKRNPQSIEIMLILIRKRIEHWSLRLSSIVSIFPIIKERIQHIMQLSKGIKSPPTLIEMANYKEQNIYQYTIPTKGVLVDPYGPGSVFYYIKNQFKLREQTKEYNDGKNQQTYSKRKEKLSILHRPSNYAHQRPDSKEIVRVENFSKDVGYTTYYDNHTRELETRIKDFLKVLNNDKLPTLEPMSDIIEKIPNMKYPKRGNLVVLKPVRRHLNFLNNENQIAEKSIKNILKKN